MSVGVVVVAVLCGDAQQVMRIEESGVAILSEPVALTANVLGVFVVQQLAHDGRGDDGVAKKLAPLTEALIRRQDDAAPFVPSRYQSEEGGGRLPVVGPDAELVHHQHLGSELDPQPAVQVVLRPGLAQVLHQFVRPDEIGAVALLDGLFGQGHRQVSLPHSGRSQEQDVGGLADEGQGFQFLNLPLVDGGLEGEVKLLQGALAGKWAILVLVLT